MSSQTRTADAVDIYTSGKYLEHNPDWHMEDASWKVGNVAGILRKNGVSPATVCEVGTGSGEALKLLADQYPSALFVGFDISPQAMAIATPKARAGLSFRLGSPFDETAQYDLVLALDVFEHVPDYMGFLRSMTQISSYQVYNIPLDLTVRSTLKPSLLMEHRHKIGHIHYFNRETALATLEETGHQILDWKWHSPAQQVGGLKGALRRAFFAVSPDKCVNIMGGFAMTVLCRRAS